MTMILRQKKEIDVLNKKIYDQDPTIFDLWKKTRQWCVEAYMDFEALLGSHFNQHVYESETWKLGQTVVEQHVGTVFAKSDDAIVFKGEKYGLHTRVFITSRGLPTYEAKDIGLIALKKQGWKFDKAIIITSHEQNGYWSVVKQAIELIYPELVGRIQHIGHANIDLKGGKMSSRTGNIVSAFGLIDIAKKQVLEKLLHGETADTAVVNTLAIGAVKYAFLTSEAHKNMSFDVEKSVSLNGNSGPYLQYAYARMKSIIRKAGNFSLPQKYTVPFEDAELALLRMIPHFAEAVHEAGVVQSPHLICTYLFDLTQTFNTFYEKVSVLNAPTDEQKHFRLALTAAVAQIVKNGLWLLGIETVEKV